MQWLGKSQIIPLEGKIRSEMEVELKSKITPQIQEANR